MALAHGSGSGSSSIVTALFAAGSLPASVVAHPCFISPGTAATMPRHTQRLATCNERRDNGPREVSTVGPGHLPNANCHTSPDLHYRAPASGNGLSLMDAQQLCR